MKQTVKIKCPSCGKLMDKEVETRINAHLQPDLKKAMLKGTLFQFECPECGQRRQIQSEFLYHDPVNKYMIYNLPRYAQMKDSLDAKLEEILDEVKVDVSDYELRIVTQFPDLVEKTQLFDHGYNDREVEIVKLLTDGLFAKERPNEKVKARYFYYYQKQPKIMYITDSDQLLVNFNDQLLTFAQDKYRKITQQPAKGEFLKIDAQWAAHALS